MASGKDKLYACSACWEAIPKQRARIVCHNCSEYHLCSNCYVIDHFSASHTKSHSTTVVTESGYRFQEPLSFNLAAASRSSDESLRRASEIPTANWGALWDVMKAPLVKLERRSSKPVVRIQTSDVRDSQSEKCSPLSQTPIPGQSPQSGEHKLRERNDVSKPKYSQPEKWESFFEKDSSPTKTFISLMISMFNCLDDKQTGYLTPEAYSRFLEMQGYPLSSNTWKMAWKKAAGACSKDIADLELGLYFSQHGISHTVIARSSENDARESISFDKSVTIDSVIEDSIAVDRNMPLLSRQGFIDICAFEYLKDPAMAHQYLMNALQGLGVWKELGDLPRAVLPSSPRIPSFQSSKETELQNKSLQDELEDGLRSDRSDRARFLSCDSCVSNVTQSSSIYFTPQENATNTLSENSTEEISEQCVAVNQNHQSNASKSLITKKRVSYKETGRGLELHTKDIQSDWSSTLSPFPTARTPRRKVETLIESYERAKNNIRYTEEKPNYRETLLSPRQIPKSMESPRGFSFSGEFHAAKTIPSSIAA